MAKFNEFEDKTILVTGGAGCIGSNLCRRLSDLNAHKVIILDNLSSAYEWNIPQADNIQFIKGDILDDEMHILWFFFKHSFEHFTHHLKTGLGLSQQNLPNVLRLQD